MISRWCNKGSPREITKACTNKREKTILNPNCEAEGEAEEDKLPFEIYSNNDEDTMYLIQRNEQTRGQTEKNGTTASKIQNDLIQLQETTNKIAEDSKKESDKQNKKIDTILKQLQTMIKQQQQQ